MQILINFIFISIFFYIFGYVVYSTTSNKTINMKKIIILIIVLLVAIIGISCFNCEEKCINTENVEKIGINYSNDNEPTYYYILSACPKRHCSRELYQKLKSHKENSDNVTIVIRKYWWSKNWLYERIKLNSEEYDYSEPDTLNYKKLEKIIE